MRDIWPTNIKNLLITISMHKMKTLFGAALLVLMGTGIEGRCTSFSPGVNTPMPAMSLCFPSNNKAITRTQCNSSSYLKTNLQSGSRFFDKQQKRQDINASSRSKVAKENLQKLLVNSLRIFALFILFAAIIMCVFICFSLENYIKVNVKGFGPQKGYR